MEALIIIAIVTLVLAIVFVALYNGIVSNANAVQRAWANVIVQERQKNIVIPEIEKVVSEYKDFEETVLKRITELRSTLSNLDTNIQDYKALEMAEMKTHELISGIRVAVEAYPELKASDLFMSLSKELQDQNDNISASIRIFNQNVESFNNGIETFPGSLVNSIFNKKETLNTFTDQKAESAFQYKPNT